MEPLISQQALSLLRGAYFGTLIGAFAFFLLWEGGAPRIAFANSGERRTHLLRNFAMLALVILIADIFVGYGLLGTAQRLDVETTNGLSALGLGWPALLLAGVLILDLFNYWWHRACHAVPWLWRLHRVHHSDTHLDATTGARFHVLETSLAIVLLIGFMTLAGIPLWIELVRTVIVNPLVLTQHANVTFPARLDRAFRPVLVTPALHRVHHSLLRAEHDRNYGQIFSIWDRLFGTYSSPPAASLAVGVAGLDGEAWQTVAGMCATPFRRA
ncbi:MAG: sterol desaturase family protein [Betaproteobacteria bacterium]